MPSCGVNPQRSLRRPAVFRLGAGVCGVSSLVVPRGKRGFLAGLPRRARKSGEQAATLVQLSEMQIATAIAFAMLPTNAYISAATARVRYR